MLIKKLFPSYLLISAMLLNVTLTSCQKDDEAQPDNAIKEIPEAEAIYLHEEYEMGVGGYMYIVYNPYLLFNDGSIYRNLDTNIDKLNVEQSKQQEPKEWGTWKKQGNEIIVVWKDDEETWEDKDWFVANKAVPGEIISGDYTSISGGGNTAFGGSVITFSASDISFKGNKFTSESTGGGSSNDITAYTSQEKAGMYESNGYSITLRFNNGIVENKFFYFYPDSKEVFGIGSGYYVQD